MSRRERVFKMLKQLAEPSYTNKASIVDSICMNLFSLSGLEVYTLLRDITHVTAVVNEKGSNSFQTLLINGHQPKSDVDW